MVTARVTIDELPERTTPADTDQLVVQDAGVTKRVTVAALREAIGSAELTEDPPGSGLYYGVDLEEVAIAALPAGGETGEVLTKLSDDDYATAWAEGGGGGVHAATHAAGSTDPVTLTQAQVTNLTTDLAAKVSTTQTISTTAPLAGGGDLSVNRTLTVAAFTDSTPGVVPLSGGGTTNFLRADATWAAPPGGGAGITSEDAVDAVAAALVEGTGIDIVYDDGANTITVTADKTEMSLTKTDVGLANVDNTADTAKPVSTAQAAADALKVDKAQTINTQTGTTYTLVLTDDSKLVTLSNASAITATVPLNSSVAFPTGTRVDLAQLGAGQVTVAATGGVTVNATPGLKCRAQYSAATLIKLATDTWLLVGDLAA